jgi:hypothetical protein
MSRRAAKTEARRQRVVKALAANPTASQRELAKAVGTNQSAVKRDLMSITKDLQGQTPALVMQWREDQLLLIAELMEEVRMYKETGKPLPLRAMDRMIDLLELQARLLGTEAPAKSMVATFEVDPETGKAREPLPMRCVHEFIVSDPDAPEGRRMATQKELDAPRQELYSPNSRQVPQLGEGNE